MLARYMRWLADEKGIEHTDYDSLWRWSTEQLDAFWASIWEFFDVRGDSGVRHRARPSGHARRGVVPRRRRSPTPSTSSAARTTSATAIHHASELRELDTMTLGRAARHDGAASPSGCGPAGWGRATAWWPTCRTCRRRSRRSWPAPRSARCGRAARRTSAPARWSTASPRSSRRCCSRWTATATTARTSIAARWWRGSRRRSAAGWRWSSFGYLDGTGWPDGFAGRATPSSSSSGCPSTIRCGCSTARAPPGCPRRSCTPRAASCWSTSRS